MVKLTLSLEKFLLQFHKDLIVPLTFGHTELLTDDIWQEYIDWCCTDEGKSYLEGGEKYQPKERNISESKTNG